MVQKTTYDDDEGSDFINSLPTPEIKTTEDLIAAATPAPVVEAPVGSRRDDVQQTSVVDNQGIIDTAKPAKVLAYEQQFGTTMEPIYATRTRETRGGGAQVEYGPPIGYRFDNGNSQYVNFDASGTYQNTQNRERPGALGNIALTVLSIAYPPIAPFIQAYKAIEAIDKGDTLGFILNAAGAGKSIPGLDKNTVNMLKDVSTGAKIIKAVETGDPLKIASSMVNLPGVDPALKDLSIVVNTAKAINDGNISGAFNGIVKMSDRDSIGRLTDRFDDIVSSSGGGDDAATIDNTEGGSGGPTLEEQAAQEQEDREQTSREQIRASEKNIDDTLADSGLVSTDTNGVQALTSVDVSGTKITDDGLDIVGDKNLSDNIADFVGKQINQDFAEQRGFPDYATYLQYEGDKAAYEASKVAATDASLAPVTVTTKALQEDDLPITTDTGGNRVTDSNLPVTPNVGTTTPTLERKEVSGKREIDTDLPITSDTGGNRVTDSSLPVNPNVGTTDGEENKLAQVEIRGKREVADLIPLEEMPPLPSSKVTPVIAGTPVLPTLPKLPGSTTTTTTGTPTTTTPVAPTAVAADAYVDKLVKAGTGFDPSAEFDPYWFSKYQKSQKATKIASGGYLDDLLANPTSFEELLQTLRN